MAIWAVKLRPEVVLKRRLLAALDRLNPDVPGQALDDAIEELTRERGVMSMVAANHEVYDLLKSGVKVTVRGPDGAETVETVKIIDWDEPANNDFLLTSQLWVSSDTYKRRPDLVGFVNGLPLVFVEFKSVRRVASNAPTTTTCATTRTPSRISSGTTR